MDWSLSFKCVNSKIDIQKLILNDAWIFRSSTFLTDKLIFLFIMKTTYSEAASTYVGSRHARKNVLLIRYLVFPR